MFLQLSPILPVPLKPLSATAMPTRNVEVSEISPAESNIASSDAATSATAVPSRKL